MDKAIKTNEIGLVKKIEMLPCERIKAVLKLVSAIGPSINDNAIGAKGNPFRLRK